VTSQIRDSGRRYCAPFFPFPDTLLSSRLTLVLTWKFTFVISSHFSNGWLGATVMTHILENNKMFRKCSSIQRTRQATSATCIFIHANVNQSLGYRTNLSGSSNSQIQLKEHLFPIKDVRKTYTYLFECCKTHWSSQSFPMMSRKRGEYCISKTRS